MSLAQRRTLGRSGLTVSPLSFGAMNFAAPRWGLDDAASEAMFNAYIDAGGNVIDTADVYSGGRSEELTGQFLRKRNLRDSTVVATKCGFSGGNSRKNIHQKLEASLRRLQTDYVDLYWMHVWDGVTPVEEVVSTLAGLVQSGKIRYYGFSDAPAWYVARAATLAEERGWPRPVAVQLPYSLVDRTIEYELAPLAAECGLGITPWAPLASGFLTGKYQRAGTDTATGDGRLSGSSPYGNSFFTDRNWDILEALRNVAAETERPMAQVALAWVLAQPAVASPIVGFSKAAQLEDAVAATDLVLEPGHLERLDAASAPPAASPYSIFTPAIRRGIFGGADVRTGR